MEILQLFCCFQSRSGEKQNDQERPLKKQIKEEENKQRNQNVIIVPLDYQNYYSSKIQNQFNNQESNEISNWNKECIEQKFDRYQLQLKNQDYDNLIIYINILYYYCEKSLKQDVNQLNNYECKGKLYQTEYDQNNNPKFRLEEGNFLINLQQKTFQKQGSGDQNEIDENIVSNNIIVYPILDNNISKNHIIPIKIIDQETNKQINNQVYNRQIDKKQQNQKIWCKYNQQLSTNDLNILENKKWMTSSIIDSYVLYLNQSSDREYFQLSKNQRKTLKRTLFFPSSLTTNFGEYQTEDKVRSLFEQEMPKFKDVKFDLSKIYRYIGFPINRRNRHWFFVLFDLTKQEVFVFDSLNKSQLVQDDKLINTIAEIFQLNSVQIKEHQYSGQQKDSYSCGYRVCSIMKFWYEKQLHQNTQYQYYEDKMISELQKLIKEL
ncbi:unnamed protein product [Paramecium sonneborni]|uniref:Ubiquitin-like protease family profile domain-containing protein n=1 Tax=Paramecium sonneborni TaxID=65129 RepID=A0A8S1R780_9CILI|nr:unnamed protein product [Paramecium sonneborni]